jgi:hypothetical protein
MYLPNSKILTIVGERDVSEIAVGTPVISLADSTQTVTEVSVVPIKSLTTLHLSNQTQLTCSTSSRFLTEDGWMSAPSLLNHLVFFPQKRPSILEDEPVKSYTKAKEPFWVHREAERLFVKRQLSKTNFVKVTGISGVDYSEDVPEILVYHIRTTNDFPYFIGGYLTFSG